MIDSQLYHVCAIPYTRASEIRLEIKLDRQLKLSGREEGSRQAESESAGRDGENVRSRKSRVETDVGRNHVGAV